MKKCRQRGIRVGLSSWFQREPEEHRLKADSPERLAAIWRTVLEAINREGLLDAVLFVDFRNEWPVSAWPHSSIRTTVSPGKARSRSAGSAARYPRCGPIYIKPLSLSDLGV
ncbi:MAG: hypothetical protein GVY36_09200 [Verrucomicrobia bacterium]|nr:hypothetical protein [Verrucomicrobiota bacterium]